MGMYICLASVLLSNLFCSIGETFGQDDNKKCSTYIMILNDKYKSLLLNSKFHCNFKELHGVTTFDTLDKAHKYVDYLLKEMAFPPSLKVNREFIGTISKDLSKYKTTFINKSSTI